MWQITRGITLLTVFALVLSLAACGGAGAAPGTARTFAFVSHPAGLLDSDPTKPVPASIGAYIVDPDTGALTPVNGSPFPALALAANRPRFIAAPDGHFLYLGGCTDLLATGKDDCTIASFAVGSDGKLSRRATLLVSGIGTDDMQIVPSGRFMYAFDSQILRTQVLGFQIGSDSRLAPLPQGVSAPGVVARMALTPSGKFLYAAFYGPLTACSVIAWPSCENVLLMAYSIDQNTGALTPVAGSPFATTLQGSGNSPANFPMIIDGQSRFLYLSAEFTQTFVAFAIDPDTGALTPLPAPEPRITTNAGTASPDGKFLFLGAGIVSPTGTPGVAGFSIGNSGRLTPAPGSPLLLQTFGQLNGGPVVLDTSGRFLYFGAAPFKSQASLWELSVGPDGALSSTGQSFNVLGPTGLESVLIVTRTP